MQDERHEWIERFFMSLGFQVNIVGYDEITEGEHSDESSENNKSFLFSAEQLRFSEAQVIERLKKVKLVPLSIHFCC